MPAGTRFGELKSLPEILPVFVIGVPMLGAPEVVDDVLLLPCSDDYHQLPQKTLSLIRWAVTQDFLFLFKCDDDTYIHPERLLQFIDSAVGDYFGQDIGTECMVPTHPGVRDIYYLEGPHWQSPIADYQMRVRKTYLSVRHYG